MTGCCGVKRRRETYMNAKVGNILQRGLYVTDNPRLIPEAVDPWKPCRTPSPESRHTVEREHNTPSFSAKLTQQDRSKLVFQR